MKRTPLRRKSRKAAVKELDLLAREVVFLRDRHRCQKCGRTTRLQWSHIHTRRIRSLRWRLENSVIHCAGCHLWWGQHPLEGARWFLETFPERARKLELLRRTPQKTDMEAERLYLLAEREKLARRKGAA